MYKFLLALAIFFYSTLNSFADQPDVKLHQKCLYPTIMISTVKSFTYGSGCIIRSEKVGERYRNMFLSCAHIFEDGKQFEVIVFKYKNWSRISKFQYFDCELYGINKSHDLAVGMFYSNEEMPFAEVEMDPKIYIGNDVFRIGCGTASAPRLDIGKITSISNSLRTNVFTVPGDSGSPVFNGYKLIGVMKSIKIVHYNEKPYLAFNISYATPSWKIEEWSNENNKSLNFMWDKTALPKLPFLKLEMREWTVK